MQFLYYLVVAALPMGLVTAKAPATHLALATSPAKARLASSNPDSIYINPQVRPQFKGGEAAFRTYLAKNLRYPAQALREHITGKVYIRFIVSAEGRITDASMASGPGHGLNDEALRLVWLMPPWQPGQQDGHPVRVSCTLPITFQ
jgi:protein TonB